jgi:hypothetical protein
MLLISFGRFPFMKISLLPNEKSTLLSYESFEDKQYFENPASYDESLPYFSDIIKMLVFSKYLENLQKIENELTPSPVVEETVTEPQEDTPPKKIVGKDKEAVSKVTHPHFLLEVPQATFFLRSPPV